MHNDERLADSDSLEALRMIHRPREGDNLHPELVPLPKEVVKQISEDGACIWGESRGESQAP